MDGGELISEAMMVKMFPDDNELGETPMLTVKCKKISRWGIPQERVLLLSTHFVYLLNQS